MTGIISLILILSIAIFSSTGGRSIALAQQEPLLQPNAAKVLKVNVSGALEAPNLGVANFFAPANSSQHIPAGIIAQAPFTCSGAPTDCGKPVPGKFNGTFEQANKDGISNVTATFKSLVDAGTFELKNHVYKIITTDFNWNSPKSALPTIQPAFAKSASDVALDGVQHGPTLDRRDVPTIVEKPGGFMYGGCSITDTNKTTDNKIQAFCHIMVGHQTNETSLFKYLRDVPTTPHLAIVIAASIPPGVPLPGNWSPYCVHAPICTAAEAQVFFPANSTILRDTSLKTPIPFAYPVELSPRSGSIGSPGPSGEQPVSLNGEPFFFGFIVYPKAELREFPLVTSGGK